MSQPFNLTALKSEMTLNQTDEPIMKFSLSGTNDNISDVHSFLSIPPKSLSSIKKLLPFSVHANPPTPQPL
jgi:hypothetical protein